MKDMYGREEIARADRDRWVDPQLKAGMPGLVNPGATFRIHLLEIAAEYSSCLVRKEQSIGLAYMYL